MICAKSNNLGQKWAEIESHQPPKGACVACPSLGDRFGLKYSQNKALGQGQP